MADADPAARSRQSLWAIVGLHLILAVVFIAFAFLLIQRQEHRQAADKDTAAAYQQKLAEISQETDINRLREMARIGWEQSDKDWKLIDHTWNLLTTGFTCLPCLPLGTAFIALWGLRRRKEKATPA